MDEVTQSLGQDQDPLPVRDLGEKFRKGMAAFHNRALGVAGGTGHAALAGERHEAAVGAGLGQSVALSGALDEVGLQ